MPKYFVDETLQPDKEMIHHLTRVLRVRVGDEIILCDGMATDYFCVVESLEPLNLKVVRNQKSDTEPDKKITLYQAIPKNDKMEWIVQKAVELGVHKVVPVISEHSVKRALNLPRLRKISKAAAEQSMRGIIPVVGEPMPWQQALQEALQETSQESSKDGGFMIAAHEKAKRPLPTNLPEKAGLWIGPEGGFSDMEIAAMEKAKFEIIGLGPRILRTETAAIAALAKII